MDWIESILKKMSDRQLFWAQAACMGALVFLFVIALANPH